MMLCFSHCNVLFPRQEVRVRSLFYSVFSAAGRDVRKSRQELSQQEEEEEDR
jgi:hypothetical protein